MAQLKAIIVNADSTVKHAEIRDDFRSFQAAVGGYIQGVFGDTATIYVDEEGLLKALPFNPVATKFANHILGVAVQLFGTALIVGPSDSEGNDTHVHPSVVSYYNLEN